MCLLIVLHREEAFRVRDLRGRGGDVRAWRVRGMALVLSWRIWDEHYNLITIATGVHSTM